MGTEHSSAVATLLADGRVLVTGGHENAPLEIFDPSTGTWTLAGHMSKKRTQHTATLLGDGRVLVVDETTPSSAEVYAASTGAWTKTGRMARVR